MSGQKINLQKSRIFFFNNVSAGKANQLSRARGIPLAANLGWFLGAQLLHERVSKSTFSSVIYMVNQQLSGWKAKNISFARPCTLIQSVISYNLYLYHAT
ncbi:hypothetical protein CFOL_v3_07539 [Cephalotus follicularis]|uniref:Uncharacterized protein n=1 Tax=Cephalotus follicularis TaxID=3775 RepID=A0A1Q3B7K1_CEPFO|nr:hypothetical protein CFOL_v3_07539 [Cephalotus follicularis]